MTTITFRVDCPPMGKERPRFAGGHSYTPKRTKEYEEKIKRAFQKAVEESGITFFPTDQRVRIECVALFGIPQSAKRKRMPDKILVGVPCVKVPDIDNILKIVQDALNKIAYLDDRQIWEGTAKKIYSDLPGLEITLEVEM